MTLLDLCCQCKWLTSTVLFLQGLHMCKYTTPRLDIGVCLISLLCTPQDCSESMVSTLLEHCAVNQLLTSLAHATLRKSLRLHHRCQKVHSAGQPRSQGLRIHSCHVIFHLPSPALAFCLTWSIHAVVIIIVAVVPTIGLIHRCRLW